MLWSNILKLAMTFGLSVLKWVMDNKELIMALGMQAFDYILNMFS